MVDKALVMLERSCDCKVHCDLDLPSLVINTRMARPRILANCDPASNKCQVLRLVRWKGTLQQEDMPHPYM